MLTLIESRVADGVATLSYQCNDGVTREARLVNGEPSLLGVHPIKWHRALERWSNSPENEQTIVGLQRAKP
jgi:hypothetical protein